MFCLDTLRGSERKEPVEMLGVISLLIDGCLIVLLVRAIVPNQGHMAFNRPFQFVVPLLEPLRRKLKLADRQMGWFSAIGILFLVGLRGMIWMWFGCGKLDFKVTVIQISHGNYVQCQLLTVIAAAVFFLQVYAFLILAIAIGGLEHRTDHYSRLLRALLGPFKKVHPWLRCVFPLLGLILVWTPALWLLELSELIPPIRNGISGCALASVPISLALIVDLARVWIGLLLARAAFSLIPFWRPPVLDCLERMTEPMLLPFRRLRLKVHSIDFTSVVSIVALAAFHWLALHVLERLYFRL